MHLMMIAPATPHPPDEPRKDVGPEAEARETTRTVRWLFRQGVKWVSEVPFRKLLYASLSYLLPPGIPAFIVGFVMRSALAGVALAFAVFVILVAIRDIYWRTRQAERGRMRQEIEEYEAEREETEKLLRGLLGCFCQDWTYVRLHAVYWLDWDQTAGRFKRTMEVEFAPGTQVQLARLETIRIGAQGDGTELHPVRDLDIKLECQTPGVEAFLVPLERNEEDVDASEHFHNFTILLACPQGMPSRVVVSLEGNWRNLWAPLWVDHVDYGALLLTAKRCEHIMVTTYAPLGAGDGEFSVKAAWPNVGFKKAGDFDREEKRFYHTLEARGAPQGEYDWTVTYKARRSRQRRLPKTKNNN